MTADLKYTNFTSVCITSAIRLKGLYSFSHSKEASLGGVNVAVWSGIEINVGIACSSVPALRPLIGQIFPSLRSAGVPLRGRVRSQIVCQDGEPNGKSYQLNMLRRMTRLGMKVDEIQVQREIQRSSMPMPTASSGSDIMECRADCYSETELTTQHSHGVV